MHKAAWLFALPLASALAQTPQISGALNFREIGGMTTADGRVVSGGLLYRSGELNTLTPADLETLAALHIRYIFDLRTDAERSAAPTNWNKPTIVAVPIGFDSKDPAASMQLLFAGGTDPAHVTAGMQTVTARIAVDGAAGIGRILLALSRGDEPAIVHCTAGKDRTGVVSAVLLTILGVSKEDVYKDYLSSNAAVPAQMMRLRQAYSGKSDAPSALSSLPIESIKVLMGVDRSFLDAAFAAIDAKYGSFSAYVSDGLKLSPADVEALRRRLTK
jgi:protein-tyrosine phosphatase